MKSWQPTATIDSLKKRAKYIQSIRNYFNNKGVWEVETPILSQAATVDSNIESFVTSFNTAGSSSQSCYLRTSPEFAMKRLLAAGSGDIFSLGSVFRNEQQGRLHNPEFTLLEWYRIDYKLFDLINEVTDLLTNITNNFIEIARFSYAELFQQHLAINPHTVDKNKLNQITTSFINITADLTVKDCLDLLFTHIIQPKLSQDNNKLNGYFIHSYPESMADLAQITYCKQAKKNIAQRFELFINGIEIANGYYELLDSQEQEQRFLAASNTRQNNNQLVYPYDKLLIAALQSGMPSCSGVALGIDRLLMLMENADELEKVLAFAFNRA